MMNRIEKVFLWCVGFLLLLLIVKLPLEKLDSTWIGTISPLEGKIIVIDPGHGGADGGAVGKEGTNEKDITLIVSKMLQKYLEQAGAIVYLTREQDKDLAGDDIRGLARRKSEDIRNRLKFIHEKEADLFLTIHLNSLSSSKWSGAQTFYYSRFPENKLLATAIQHEIIRNLENTDRVPLEINGIYLLKHAQVPGALVEIGFLSNERELQLLKKKSYQQKMAASIYKGLLNYLTLTEHDLLNSVEK